MVMTRGQPGSLAECCCLHSYQLPWQLIAGMRVIGSQNTEENDAIKPSTFNYQCVNRFKCSKVPPCNSAAPNAGHSDPCRSEPARNDVTRRLVHSKQQLNHSKQTYRYSTAKGREGVHYCWSFGPAAQRGLSDSPWDESSE